MQQVPPFEQVLFVSISSQSKLNSGLTQVPSHELTSTEIEFEDVSFLFGRSLVWLPLLLVSLLVELKEILALKIEVDWDEEEEEEDDEDDDDDDDDDDEEEVEDDEGDTGDEDDDEGNNDNELFNESLWDCKQHSSSTWSQTPLLIMLPQ